MLKQSAQRARSALRKVGELPRQSTQNILRQLDTELWERTRYRPGFNADSFLYMFPEAAKLGTGPIIGGRLAVRIAFHYVPARLKYLKETVDAIRAFPFREIDVFIDTNSHEFAARVDQYAPGATACVWTDLDHPFKLTWVHRRAFLEQAEDYDTFAYLEDDIAIPRNTMRRWLEEYEHLAPHGFLPGFLRVEEGRDGALYLSDFRTPVGREHIIELDGRLYLDNPYPYQACWLCHKDQLDEFAKRDSFLNGTIATYPAEMTERDGALAVREQVAFGLTYEEIPSGRFSRMLIPLDEDGQIAPDTLIAHIPCNYTRLKVSHPAKLGTIPLDQALEG